MWNDRKRKLTSKFFRYFYPLNESYEGTGKGENANSDSSNLCQKVEKPDQQGLTKGGIIGTHDDKNNHHQPNDKPNGRTNRWEEGERQR